MFKTNEEAYQFFNSIRGARREILGCVDLVFGDDQTRKKEMRSRILACFGKDGLEGKFTKEAMRNFPEFAQYLSDNELQAHTNALLARYK